MPENVDLSQLAAAHTPAAIQARLRARAGHTYLRDFVYGAIDGAVTTFAVVSGVAGAELSAGLVIVLGMANLIADGFSMAVGNFLGTRAECQLREKARRAEEFHLAALPEGEREEIRQIFAAKGFKGQDLERVVAIITSDERQWVDTMLREELGLALESSSAWRAAVSTFVAFLGAGALPLLAFIYQAIVPQQQIDAFRWSAVMTGLAFIVVGALKGRFVGQRWYTSAGETLLLGGVAAGLAYVVGVLLRGVANTG